MNNRRYDVIIIGAGAAGLMCAIEAGKRESSAGNRNKVLLIDKADKIGKKILISGGGRCNFTNLYASPDDFLSNNPHFCKSALSRYTQWDFIALLESHKLTWTEKTLGQLFCDQKSGAVVDALVAECKSFNIEFSLNTVVSNIQQNKQSSGFMLETGTEIETKKGELQCDSLVIATGGPSIPAMGSTDFALNVAKQFFIPSIPFSAALVPFTFTPQELDYFIKDLSGIATDVELCAESGKCFKEAILFTHRGISGPAALQISSYWKVGESISVNLFPDGVSGITLFDWLIEQQDQHPNAELKTILSYQLPKRLVTKLCDFLVSNKVMKTYQTSDLENLVSQLTNWQLTPAGTEGLRTAEVCLGGVNTDALSSKTFETKSVKGLYFIGESVDVTGNLGGFNFQWAWASGWCAGQYV